MINLPNIFIIAIDGPAASGKGTIARKLADFFQLPHLDTGLTYRAVAHGLMQEGLELDDEKKACEIAEKLDLGNLDANILRAKGMGEAAAKVAVLGELRKTMRQRQQSFADKPPGIVMDGRDIATVVFPEADAKLFITAEAEIRAERRYMEMKNKGFEVNLEDILSEILKRDEKDRTRKIAPLKKTEDSLLCDTSKMSIEEAFETAKKLVITKLPN